MCTVDLGTGSRTLNPQTHGKMAKPYLTGLSVNVDTVCRKWPSLLSSPDTYGLTAFPVQRLITMCT